MRILIINTAGLAIGGITTHIYNYISRLQGKGYDFDLVVTGLQDDESINLFKEIGCRLFFLPDRQKKPLVYGRSLYELLKKNKYGIVHVHGSSHTICLDLLACRIAGVKVRIAHSHNTTCNSATIHKFLAPVFNVLCTDGLACGIEAGKWMFGKKSFMVLNNGIDTNRFRFRNEVRARLRKELGWEANYVIGHVGGFIGVKNQKFVVEVFERIFENNTQYRLLLIGDGPMKNEIEQFINCNGLKNVTYLTGNIVNVEDYVNVMDVVLMPSLYEGLPLTLIEQQANGLNCIVSDTITKEVNKSGNVHFISLSNSAAKWADFILKLEEANSRAERSEDAIKRIIASGYDVSNEVAKLGDFYMNAYKGVSNII